MTGRYPKQKKKMNNFSHPSPPFSLSGLGNSSPTVTTHNSTLGGFGFGTGFGTGFELASSTTGTAGTAAFAAVATAPSIFGGQGQRSSSTFSFVQPPSSPPPLTFPIGQRSSTPSSSFAIHSAEKETEPWRSKEAPQEARMPGNTQTNFSSETEGSSKQAAPQQSGVPGNAKTNLSSETEEGSSKQAHQNSGLSSLSAITREIPCYFEGTSYSSFRPLQPTYVPAGESIKVEKLEKSELNPLSSKIIKVSRILKGIPQNPHFSPLKGYSEVAKQSLINAWDHIFEETIDQIKTMQVSGFWVDAKRLWETMQELQIMGYNVIVLRRRLVELTDVMVKLRRHRSDIRGLRRKAEQHRLEKSRLEFEIVKLRAKVEAEKVAYEHVMAEVVKMEDEVPNFDDVFAKLAIK